MKRDVDIRKDVYTSVVLSSGTTTFQRIGGHITVDFSPSTMSSCFTERKYSVFLLEPNAFVALRWRTDDVYFRCFLFFFEES